MFAIVLVPYHFLFFNKFYRNPYLLSTSEIASTYFPFWRWCRGKISLKSDIYYRYPACIPFLSSFYPWHILSSYISKFLTIDRAFRLFVIGLLGHYLLGSFMAYLVFREWAGEIPSIFGAITLIYSGYAIKPQTPSFVYTMAWMPGMLIKGVMGPISCFMEILGGYWPILVYFAPVAFMCNFEAFYGVFLALPQILAFLWYWPKSIRAGSRVDRNFGKVPWLKLRDLFIPSNSINQTNGVHFPEMEMYMGLALLFIWGSHSRFWFVLIGAILIVTGILPSIERIPARALYLVTFSITVLAVDTLRHFGNELIVLIILIQAYLLLRNSNIYPSFPFSQWWERPSILYSKPVTEKWPFFSGYHLGRNVSDYKGAFALRE